MAETHEYAPGDPRPVFTGGAWNSATAAEKEAHNGRIRAWKEAQGMAVGERTGAHERRGRGRGAEAQSQAGAGIDPQPPPIPSPVSPDAVALALSLDPNYLALQRIRDDHTAHDSDRIRAIDGMRRMEQGAEAEAHGPTPLVALRHVLDTLQPHERLAWLQGERIAGLQAQADEGA